MAVNSKYKRISMLRYASPWGAAALLFSAQVSGLDGPDRGSSLHLYGGNAPYNENTPPVTSPDSATVTSEVPTDVDVASNDVETNRRS